MGPPESYYDPAAYLAESAAEERSFWARGRNALVVWALRTYFPEARSLFEVGCGTGIVLRAIHEALPELRLFGSDVYRPALAEARRRLADATFVEADAESLRFNEDFDVVAALDVLEHLDDDSAALRGLHRAVRVGGGALIAVPQHPWLWSPADDWWQHRRRYSRRELAARVRAAGFEIVRATSFVSLLLPAMAAARLVDRGRATYDPLAQFHLPPRIDTLLEQLVRADLFMIAHGVSLPVGGSLVVIARKPQSTSSTPRRR